MVLVPSRLIEQYFDIMTSNHGLCAISSDMLNREKGAKRQSEQQKE